MSEAVRAVDHVTEKEFAKDVGLSPRSLEAQRQRGLIPEGEVWVKQHGRIFNSSSGWDSWVEKQRNSLMESRSKVIESSSASAGTASGAAKRTRIRQHRKTSKEPAIYAVK